MNDMKTKQGFSLIEVTLAILLASSGLLAIFALFPDSLRQSVMSDAELKQCTFASSLFEAMTANIKNIDNVEDWNNPAKFWKEAASGLQYVRNDTSSFMTVKQANASSSPISEVTRMVLLDQRTKDEVDFGFDANTGEVVANGNGAMHYVANEYTMQAYETASDGFLNGNTGRQIKPQAQYLIRVMTVQNNFSRRRHVNVSPAQFNAGPNGRGTALGPNSYVVSVISTDLAAPAIYKNNAVYSQEFYFHRRP